MISAECAFHQRQLITNFCACRNCLLPVCPSCIKLHSQEHRINGSSPKFEQIKKVYQQVRSQQINIQAKVSQIAYELLQIEKMRKQNENLIRKKFVQFKAKLIKQIDRYISDMQHQILNRIVKQDESFISNLQEIDDCVFQKQRQVQIQQSQLHGKEFLKTLICHYSQNRKQRHQIQVQKMKLMVHQIGKQTMYISFEQGCLYKMEDLIKETITVHFFQQSKSK